MYRRGTWGIEFPGVLCQRNKMRKQRAIVAVAAKPIQPGKVLQLIPDHLWGLLLLAHIHSRLLCTPGLTHKGDTCGFCLHVGSLRSRGWERDCPVNNWPEWWSQDVGKRYRGWNESTGMYAIEQVSLWPTGTGSGGALEDGAEWGSWGAIDWFLPVTGLGLLMGILRVPWTARRSDWSILKEISPEHSLKDWCWSWNSNTLATWCEKLTRLKRPWCWERLKAGGEVDDRGWDGWMTSLTRWTWVWVNPGSWWWTGRPGVLQSVGSQKAGHNWVTEPNWTNGNIQVALVVKNLPAKPGNVKDSGSIPGSGRSPGEENGMPLQYSCLEHAMDRGAWWAIVHSFAKSWTRLKQLNTHVWEHPLSSVFAAHVGHACSPAKKHPQANFLSVKSLPHISECQGAVVRAAA